MTESEGELKRRIRELPKQLQLWVQEDQDTGSDNTYSVNLAEALSILDKAAKEFPTEILRFPNVSKPVHLAVSLNAVDEWFKKWFGTQK